WNEIAPETIDGPVDRDRIGVAKNCLVTPDALDQHCWQRCVPNGALFELRQLHFLDLHTTKCCRSAGATRALEPACILRTEPRSACSFISVSLFRVPRTHRHCPQLLRTYQRRPRAPGLCPRSQVQSDSIDTLCARGPIPRGGGSWLVNLGIAGRCMRALTTSAWGFPTSGPLELA